MRVLRPTKKSSFRVCEFLYFLLIFYSSQPDIERTKPLQWYNATAPNFVPFLYFAESLGNLDPYCGLLTLTFISQSETAQNYALVVVKRDKGKLITSQDPAQYLEILDPPNRSLTVNSI